MSLNITTATTSNTTTTANTTIATITNSVNRCSYHQHRHHHDHRRPTSLLFRCHTAVFLLVITFCCISCTCSQVLDHSSVLSQQRRQQQQQPYPDEENRGLVSKESDMITQEKTTTTLTLPLLNHKQFIHRLVRERRLGSIGRHGIHSREDDDDGNYENDDDGVDEEESSIEEQIQEIKSAHVEHDDFPFGKLYQGIGTHYVDLWVGTPHPQRQTVIVDTGSHITSFPCDPCQDCGYGYHTDTEYRIQESTSFSFEKCGECAIGKCKRKPSKMEKDESSLDTCEISMSYAEGSKWKAFEARDVVYIGGKHDGAQDGRERRQRDRYLVAPKDDEEELQQQQSVQEQTFARNLRRKLHKETKAMEEEFRKKAEEMEMTYELQREKEMEENRRKHVSAKDFAFELKFGCQYMITGLFKTQLADGIMGMEDADTAFWTQMYNAGKISSRAFSLCYAHGEDASRNGTDAGAITLGGANADLHKSPMVYAEYVGLDGWYGVRVGAMYLRLDPKEEEEMDASKESRPSIVKLDLNIKKMNSKGIMIDSGTTDSIFPSMTYEPFKKAFKELMGFDFVERVPYNKETNMDPSRDYPTILIQLKADPQVQMNELVDKNGLRLPSLANDLDPNAPNDVIVEIPPFNYMTWSRSSKKFKNRFRMDDDSGWGLIGANGMLGHDILFDLENRRIGVAKSDCIVQE